VSKNVEARIDNRREWGQSKAAVNCSDLIQPRREAGALDRATQGEVQMLGTDRGRERVSGGTVQVEPQNYRGHGEPRFVPSLKAAGKGPNVLNRCTLARELMQGSTV
jgi:hypothetical protein